MFTQILGIFDLGMAEKLFQEGYQDTLYFTSQEKRSAMFQI